MKIVSYLKNYRNFQKLKTQAETGRSMVEMLGVLAIIGVLSIGGIMGYVSAMNRYRANQIADMATKYAAIAFTSHQNCLAAQRDDCDLPSFCDTGLVEPDADGNCKVSNATIKDPWVRDNNMVRLTIVFEEKDVNVCKALASAYNFKGIEEADACYGKRPSLAFESNHN